MKTTVKWLLVLLLAGFAAIQFIPVQRTNPLVRGEVPAPPEVQTILRRSCYDCHSNLTRWPWYSNVAPASWLIARDVQKGRAEMNFTEWDDVDTKRQVEAMHESWEAVSEGEMPPWFYVGPHPRAQLANEDLTRLRAWSLSQADGEEEENED